MKIVERGLTQPRKFQNHARFIPYKHPSGASDTCTIEEIFGVFGAGLLCMIHIFTVLDLIRATVQWSYSCPPGPVCS